MHGQRLLPELLPPARLLPEAGRHEAQGNVAVGIHDRGLDDCTLCLLILGHVNFLHGIMQPSKQGKFSSHGKPQGDQRFSHLVVALAIASAPALIHRMGATQKHAETRRERERERERERAVLVSLDIV